MNVTVTSESRSFFEDRGWSPDGVWWLGGMYGVAHRFVGPRKQRWVSKRRGGDDETEETEPSGCKVPNGERLILQRARRDVTIVAGARCGLIRRLLQIDLVHVCQGAVQCGAHGDTKVGLSLRGSTPYG